jgi:hypothetical protein
MLPILLAEAIASPWQERKYSGSRLDAVHFDLSPNLSPTRREALILTPLPLQGRGWGLGFSAVLHAIEKCYRHGAH